MSEAEMLYKYNVDDEALERIFNERDEFIESRIRCSELLTQRDIEDLRARAHKRFDALEKKTRRLQAQGIIIFSGLCGVCGGLGLAAAFVHDWLSMAAILAIGAIFALFWAVIGR